MLFILLVAIREIVALQFNQTEKRLFKDYLVQRKAPDILSLEYGINTGVLKDTCSRMMRKLKEGLINFGLGWVLQ